MTDPSSAAAWELRARRRMEAHATRIATDLRRLADSVERNGGRPRSDDTGYVGAAGIMVHEITWGVANLNLSALLDAARDADEARLEALAASRKEITPQDVLNAIVQVAEVYAATMVENDEARGVRNVRPAEEQTFRLGDIRRIAIDVARELETK